MVQVIPLTNRLSLSSVIMSIMFIFYIDDIFATTTDAGEVCCVCCILCQDYSCSSAIGYLLFCEVMIVIKAL